MVDYFKNWLRRYLNNPEIISLLLTLVLFLIILIGFNKILMPVFISIVIAYLLYWIVARLQHWKVPKSLAVILVYTLFIGVVVIALLGLLPPLWQQLSNLVNELPNTLNRGQTFLMLLPQKYPGYVSSEQVQQVILQAKSEIAKAGQLILSASFSSIPSVLAVIVYLVLVPLLVYFFLMDHNKIFDWLGHYLPKNRQLLQQVWQEVHTQIGNYIGGKIIEILVVWAVCYIAFLVMGLQYAMLLSALVGLSVVVPYIGAVVVTIPVIIIAFLQWGWTADFFYLLVVYAIIIALDANVLVPLLFSEAVNLHPVAIIIAILFFGGIWGFWGVFFAIPLATVVKAVLNALAQAKPYALKKEID